jgi:arsenate reductase
VPAGGRRGVSAFPITVWHNPACGTSRKVLELIGAAGHPPTVIEYLNTGWERAELQGLLADAGLSPREVLRERGTAAKELGLTDPSTPDAVILEAMLAHPSLVNRPLVRTPKGVRLARPPETVLELLDS